MAETGRWNGHTFTVSAKKLYSFTGLTVKGSSETKDKKSGSQQYVARKNGKPVEISLTVKLHAMTGCDVRKEAMALVSDASAGKKDYFYVGGQKLVGCQLMLVSADVKEVMISPGNKWVRADVALTLKQCTKGGSTSKKTKTTKKKSTKKKASKGGGSGSSGGSGGGYSNKVSVQGTSAKQSSGTTSFVKKIASAYGSVAVKAGNFIKNTVKGALTLDGISSAAYTGSRSSSSYSATRSTVSSAYSSVYKNTIQPAKSYSIPRSR